MIITWPIIKGTGAMVSMLAVSTLATNRILAAAISEDTPITLKTACYIGGAILTVAIWLNKNQTEIKTAFKRAAEAAELACHHAESANQVAVKMAGEMGKSINDLKIQLDNLPCHKVVPVNCPPKPNKKS